MIIKTLITSGGCAAEYQVLQNGSEARAFKMRI